MGRQSLRALLERPDLTLVGVHATTPDKVGRDAAELCDWDEPTGVTATASLDDLLATGADVCLYMPLWPDADELCALLTAGINVCTSAAWMDGSQWEASERDRIEEAAHRGGASIYGSGAHPGLSTGVALALSGGAVRVDEIRILESVDASAYASGPTMEAMGFGRDPETPGLADHLAHESRVFAESAAVIADALGVEISRHSFEATFSPATADADLGFIQIPEGSVAGILGLHRAWAGERCVVTTGFNWTMGPHVTPPKPIQHGHVIQLFGLPNLRTVVHTLPPKDCPPEQWADLGMMLTAMPVLNAAAAVVAAPPGIVTLADLYPVTGSARR